MKNNLEKTETVKSRKTNYRGIVSETKKEWKPRQMSVRVGPDTIERLDEYTRRYHLKKVDFVRDAVNYWISVGGKAANLNEKIRRLESKLNQSREINKRLRERMYDKINYLNSIISEKDKLIAVQEELLSHYKKK